MEITSDTRVVSGKHNGRNFVFESGVLSAFGESWDIEKIKTLVEIANLLKHNGFELINKIPPTPGALEMFRNWKLSDCLDDEPDDGA